MDVIKLISIFLTVRIVTSEDEEGLFSISFLDCELLPDLPNSIFQPIGDRFDPILFLEYPGNSITV